LEPNKKQELMNANHQDLFNRCLWFVVGLGIMNFFFFRHDYFISTQRCFQILERKNILKEIFLWALSRGNDYFFPNQRYFQIFSKKLFASHNGMKETRVLLDEGFA